MQNNRQVRSRSLQKLTKKGPSTPIASLSLSSLRRKQNWSLHSQIQKRPKIRMAPKTQRTRVRSNQKITSIEERIGRFIVTQIGDLKTAHSDRTLMGNKGNNETIGKSSFQGKSIFLSDTEKAILSPAVSIRSNKAELPTREEGKKSPSEETKEKGESPKTPDTEKEQVAQKSALKEKPTPEHKSEMPPQKLMLKEKSDSVKPALDRKELPEKPLTTVGAKQVAKLRYGEIDSFDKDPDVSTEKIVLKNLEQSKKPSKEEYVVMQSEDQKELQKIVAKVVKEEKRRPFTYNEELAKDSLKKEKEPFSASVTLQPTVNLKILMKKQDQQQQNTEQMQETARNTLGEHQEEGKKTKDSQNNPFKSHKSPSQSPIRGPVAAPNENNCPMQSRDSFPSTEEHKGEAIRYPKEENQQATKKTTNSRLLHKNFLPGANRNSMHKFKSANGRLIGEFYPDQEVEEEVLQYEIEEEDDEDQDTQFITKAYGRKRNPLATTSKYRQISTRRKGNAALRNEGSS
eukprot:TRINITY_DN71266_c0_g1_i1.p1 TRINITY_DN71266_c0_g1~~TRINITY_DN71266_c0_g1_i1.p1  ORF type:complete len:514 (-),score=64.70 TRINITY_DN71266_c0_g1_i1:431-1972(-)